MLLIPVVLSLLMLLVLFYDISKYVIPNWLVLLILALWVPAMWSATAPVDWVTAIIVGVAAFAVGFIIFISKLMGGGDVKLLAACCVWTGLDALAPYLLAVAVLGGMLSLLLLFLRPAIAFAVARMDKPPALPRIFLAGEPVPYGVAIALGFLIVLWMGKLPGVAIP